MGSTFAQKLIQGVESRGIQAYDSHRGIRCGYVPICEPVFKSRNLRFNFGALHLLQGIYKRQLRYSKYDGDVGAARFRNHLDCPVLQSLAVWELNGCGVYKNVLSAD